MDLIDRQAAIDIVEFECGKWRGLAKTIVKEIEQLPSASPKGKWIPVTNGRGGFECNKCHNYAPSYQDGVEWLSDFCPNCGAEMEDLDG